MLSVLLYFICVHAKSWEYTAKSGRKVVASTVSLTGVFTGCTGASGHSVRMKTRSDQKHMSVQDLPHLMSTAEAAEYLGISPGTLNNWRSAEVGPDYAVIGRRVRYAAEDIDAWRRAHMVRTRESVA